MTTNHLAIETRPAMQGNTMSPYEHTLAALKAASEAATARMNAPSTIRPLAARYYETKLAVESVMHNLETAVSDSPHEDNATEADLARIVNALAKLRIALQEVAR